MNIKTVIAPVESRGNPGHSNCGFLQRGKIYSALPVWCCFLLSVLVAELLWGSDLYGKHVGADFSLTAPSLIEGKYWFMVNGWFSALLNPPWFTPAWCAGAGLFADPQSAFYSPVQWFALWFNPFLATHLSMIAFVVTAFWGSYFLARRILHWKIGPAIVFAVLGAGNSFAPLHSALGSAGFQPLYLWTLLALALCWRKSPTVIGTLVGPSIAVALVLTGWVQFGFGGMLIPAVLGTLLFCLALAVMRLSRIDLITTRIALGGLFALLLNGSRLYENISLLRNFPRSLYSMIGLDSLSATLSSIVQALLLHSETTANYARRHLIRNEVEFLPSPGEWAHSFGVGALVMSAACLLLWLRSVNRPQLKLAVIREVSSWFALVGCLVIAAIPILLIWSEAPVRSTIKLLPVLNSTTWPMRWIVIYIPLVQLALASPVRALMLQLQQRNNELVVVCAAMIWLGAWAEPLGFYRDGKAGLWQQSPYLVAPTLKAFVRAQRGEIIPIESVTINAKGFLFNSRNDAMYQGASEAFCYNPIYGYLLENLPQQDRFEAGNALFVDSAGRSLISNPACLIHPAENHCSPGDGFDFGDSLQREQAARFLAREPITWNRPRLGQLLSWLSVFSWCVLFLVLIAALGRSLHHIALLKLSRSPVHS